METPINNFMHVYFYVYLINLILKIINLILTWDEYDKLSYYERRLIPANPLALIQLVLFIVSFNY